MAALIKERVTPTVDGDFVVFLIGMRVNKPWKPWKWLPVFMAMPRMLRELARNPESGLLGARLVLGSPLSPMVVQYWRSFEQLERYARDRDQAHLPAWAKFNRAVGSNGDVGIWHETYLVPAANVEAVYNNMPRTGLGAAFPVEPAVGRKRTAAQRAGLRDSEGEGLPG
ncbi:MAG: DUF4188 domain-containing protein [Dehalococcoidia bacterium]